MALLNENVCINLHCFSGFFLNVGLMASKRKLVLNIEKTDFKIK